jgi:hypothetical protein
MTMPITDPDQIKWHIDQIDVNALHTYMINNFPTWNINPNI